MTIADRIKALRDELAGATPGPWRGEGAHDICSPAAKPYIADVAGNYHFEEGGIVEESDRDAIVALMNAAPALLAVAEAALALTAEIAAPVADHVMRRVLLQKAEAALARLAESS